MDPGESLEETARREVMEEVGLEVDELKLMNVFSGPEQYYQYPNGDQVFNVTAVYTATDLKSASISIEVESISGRKV